MHGMNCLNDARSASSREPAQAAAVSAKLLWHHHASKALQKYFEHAQNSENTKRVARTIPGPSQ